MSHVNRILKVGASLVVAALVAASCSGSSSSSSSTATVPPISTAAPATVAPATTAAPTTTTTTTTSAPIVAVDGAEFGPYQVGRATLSLVDDSRNGRTLPVDIWYPVDPGITADPSVYSFAPSIEYTSEHALNAPHISGDGPFPLVIYSHGNNGIRWVSAFLTERLASHGFIVVAPDHVGNTLVDAFLSASDDFDVVAANRLADIEFVLNSVLDGTGSPVLEASVSSIDSTNIGIVGHSLGGWTELSIAGDSPDSPPDPRIKAIVGMAAFTESIPDEVLQSINVPTLLIGGTLDETTPIDTNLDRPFEQISGRPLYRVDIEGAGHQSFSDVCLYQELLPTVPGMPKAVIAAIDSYALNGCTDAHLDWREAQRIVDTYAIGFFIDHLTDRVDAAPIFEPTYIDNFPAATFATAGN